MKDDLITAFIQKLPTFDFNWSEEMQAQWFNWFGILTRAILKAEGVL